MSTYELQKNLPLRLAKRKLLGELHFPIDPKFITLCVEEDIGNALNSRATPFYILTTPTQSNSIERFFPKFFEAPNHHIVFERTPYLYKRKPWKEMVQSLESVRQTCLIHIASPIWTRNAISCRVACGQHRDWIVELESECVPRLMGQRDDPSKRILLEGSGDQLISMTSSIQSTQLRDALVMLIRLLGEKRQSIRALSDVGPNPVLEMCIDPPNALFVVDVDWPEQWIRS